MTRKCWSELSGRQQAAIAAAAVVQEALAVATLWDLRHRPSAQIRGSKKLWVVAAFVNFVGPLTYFTVGRRGGSTRAQGRRRRRLGGPVLTSLLCRSYRAGSPVS